MRVVNMDLDKGSSLSELLALLRNNRVHKGDHLRIFSSRHQGPVDQFALIVFLFHLLNRFFVHHQHEHSEHDFGDEVINGLFSKYVTADELERELEKEYGIEISLMSRDPEDADWLQLSTDGFSKSYGEGEPDYSILEVKEPSPHYWPGH